MTQPVIKWSGSKRKLAKFIVPHIPENGTYFEPFIGGGSILGAVGPRKSYAGDVIPELIALWNTIKDSPDELAEKYEKHWNGLQNEGHTYYYKVRESFNKKRGPAELLFLSRTCVNGLIRFNSAGDFNNSLHHTRPGIHPVTLAQIIHEWSGLTSKTTFLNTDYKKLLAKAKKNDVVYLDPPYMGNKGRYQKIDFKFEELWNTLEELNMKQVHWVLSLDGKSGDRNYSKALQIPLKLSKQSFLLDGENSAFPRLLNNRLDKVKESLFVNFHSEI
jgi:DNA adenine methylase